MKKSLFYLLFLLLLVVMPLAAQESAVEKEEHVKLVKLGDAAAEKKEYATALEYFLKAEVLATKKQLPKQMISIKLSIGNMYLAMSNYGEALGYYKEVIAFAEKSNKNKEIIPIALNNIALMYCNEMDYTTAIEYSKRGYDYAKAQNYSYSKVLSGVNLSDIYNKTGQYKEARRVLLEIKDTPKSDQFAFYFQANYAETFLIEGKVDEAQRMVEELYKTSEYKNYLTGLLSKIYAKQNKIDLAIAYAEKAVKDNTEPTIQISLYDELYELYFSKGDYQKTKYYKNAVIKAKDSLAKLINRGLYESNKVKLKEQEYESEIKHNRDRLQLERILFAIGGIFLLLLFFTIYRSMQNRILKQKQEKIIADNQQKIISLELESLRNNIAEKNRKLSAKALYLSGRNELVEEIINSVAKIPQLSQNKEVSDQMKTLKNYLKADEKWDDFISYFEEVNPNFIKFLKEKYPQLTSDDTRFICYLYMNLDLKEISGIFNITAEAAKKRKQRIAKKMEIATDDLHDYLLKIE